MKFVKYALDYCNTRVGNEARNFIAKSVPRHIHYPSILKLQCLFRRVSEINAIFMNQTSLRLFVIFLSHLKTARK